MLLCNNRTHPTSSSTGDYYDNHFAAANLSSDDFQNAIILDIHINVNMCCNVFDKTAVPSFGYYSSWQARYTSLYS